MQTSYFGGFSTIIAADFRRKESCTACTGLQFTRHIKYFIVLTSEVNLNRKKDQNGKNNYIFKCVEKE